MSFPSDSELAENTIEVFPPRRKSLDAGQLRYWFGGGAALFIWGLYVSLTVGVNMGDEAWFLQVVRRVTMGDVLYRDVFFGATPFSVYITVPVIWIFGAEIVALKAVAAICFTSTVLLCCRIALQLGLPRQALYLLVMALVAYAGPPAAALYQPLATLFLLASFSAVLDWQTEHEEEHANGTKRGIVALIAAGGSAGLAWASKQDIGFYVLAALLLTVGVAYIGERKRPGLRVAIGLVLASFLFVASLVVLPVWLSGGAEKFLEYGFTNKGTYLRFAGLSYLDGLTALALGFHSPWSFENARQMFIRSIFLLPPMAFAGLLLMWPRFVRRERGVGVAMFSLLSAAFAGVFPRAHILHLTVVIPMILIVLVYVWQRAQIVVPRNWAWRLQAGALLVLGVWALNTLVPPLIHVASDRLAPSTLSHLSGVLISPDKQAQIRADAAALATAAAEGPLFISSPYAGFYYLVAGLSNPTPFDFPLVTAFGHDGEEQVTLDISRGKIQVVCLQHVDGPLRPQLLESYIQEYMERGSDLSFCALYYTRPWPVFGMTDSHNF